MKFADLYKDLILTLRESGIYEFWSVGAGMQYFTDHGLGHCERIQTKLEEFDVKYQGILTEDEKDILSLAIAVHDIGCAVVRKGHAAVSYIALRGAWGASYYYLPTLDQVSNARDKFRIAAVVANLHSSTPLRGLVKTVTGGEPEIAAATEQYRILDTVDRAFLGSISVLKLGGLMAFLDACDNDMLHSTSNLERTPASMARFIEEQVNYLPSEQSDALRRIGFDGEASDLRAAWNDSEPFWIAPRYIRQISFSGSQVEVHLDVDQERNSVLTAEVAPALYWVVVRYVAKDLQLCCDAFEAAGIAFPISVVRVVDSAARLDFSIDFRETLDTFRQNFLAVGV